MNLKGSDVQIINACSQPGNGVVNEDLFGWNNSAVWVLDGATGVAGGKLSSPSDAFWFVHTFSRHLDYQLISNPELSTLQILKNAIKSTRNEYCNILNIENFDLSDIPSAAFIMVRKIGNELEVSSLGDCKALYLNEGEGVDVFYDNSIEPFEKRTFNALINLRAEQPSLNQGEILKLLKPTIQANRKFMNKSNGYNVLSLMDIDKNNVKFCRINPKQDTAIALMSDGFLRYSEVLGAGDYQELYDRVVKGDVSLILNEIRDIENSDAQCLKHIRVKKSDDATCLVAKFY